VSDAENRWEAAGLLDRDQELDALGGVVARAADGRGGALLVEGEPGIGKTRLCEAGLTSARAAGLAVAGARGRELERDFAFGVVRQLFEPALMKRRRAEVERRLDGPAGAARAVFGLAPEPPGVDPSGAAQHGLYRLCLNLAARQPLLLVVDDAHWCDTPSLRWLSYFAARVMDAPVALLIAARAAVGRARPQELAAIAAEPATTTVSLGPLGEAAAAKLAELELGRPVDAEFAGACRLASGGNPFLLRALLTALRDERIEPGRTGAARVAEVTPDQVSERLLQRLAGLPAEARALARAVCVLDRPLLAQAASLAELDAPAAAKAADLLAEAAVLAPGRPLEFRHPLIENAVYSGMRPAQRGRFHRRAARRLAGAGTGAEDVAAQLMRLEPEGDPWNVEWLVEAARRARERGAPEVAAIHLRRALEEPPAPGRRPTVLRDLGSVELQAGQPTATEHLRQALDLATDVATRAAIAEELARAMTMAGRVREAVAVLDRCADEAGPADRETALRLRAAQYGSASALTDPEERRSELGKMAALGAVAGDTPAERFLLVSMAFQAMQEGRPVEEAVGMARRAMADGRLLDELTAASPFLYGSILVAVLADRYEEAESWLEAALADANERDSRMGEALGLGWLAELEYRRGRLAAAEAHARRSLELADLYALAGAVPISMACLIAVLIESGRLRDGEAALSKLGLAEETESPFLHFGFLVGARGHLRVAQGRFDAGLADLRACGARLEAHGIRTPAHVPWRSHMAVALVALGRREEAIGASDEDVAVARVQGAPRALAHTLRVAGSLRRGDQEIALLRESCSLLEDSPAELERAHALVALGAALRRARHRRGAGEPLRLGLDIAARCKAEPLAQRAREELVATGARPRRGALRGPAALTASERRVADLAAEGSSNREIARRLSVTVRTVELHLTHAYAKLGIASRRELRRALALQGSASTGGPRREHSLQEPG
jgi:DNA-binding CsgD family transcriptional regulator